MRDSSPIYNSRLFKVYQEYLHCHHPEVDIESILDQAGMTPSQLAESGHWFSQQEADRFQEQLVKATGDPSIARKVGRFVALSEQMRPFRRYTLALMGLKTLFMLLGSMQPMLTRGVSVKTISRGPRQVEIVCTPQPGVREKAFQCENRIGTYESLGQLFTPRLARVEHPQCIHREDPCCRYLVSWDASPTQRWKQVRDVALLMGIPVVAIAAFTTPGDAWLIGFLAYSASVLLLGNLVLTKKNAELARIITAQGESSRAHLDEMNIRYNNALLIQEIGQVTSSILDHDRLIEAIVQAMKKRLDFDRGLIMLPDPDGHRLLFAGGYGYDAQHSNLLAQTSFHLNNPRSKGLFVTVFRDRQPVLINDIHSIAKDLSPHSLDFAKQIGACSLICVPLVFENRSVGILAIDNIITKRALTQTDVSLLSGIASQTAVSLANAKSFQRLLESETKYRELVENANSIILRCNVDGKITFFNEFAQRFFGIGEVDILGAPMIGSILPENEENRRNWDQLLNSIHQDIDRPFVTESECLLGSGERAWIAWTYKPIFTPDGQVSEVLCIGNDVTPLKQAQREKADLEKRLQLARKMEAIGTLAGGVAHDLNNILAGIVGYPELLLMDMPPDHPMRKDVETIKKSGEKAALIVQDLLTLARRGVATRENVDLNQIITDYMDSPEYLLLKRIHPKARVKLFLDRALPAISGSPVHLAKTLMNLVSNAFEAMPEGGELTLSTHHRYLTDPIHGFEGRIPGHFVILTVADTGTGIPQEDIDKIFEPFYTKKEMGRSGTGLGMAVVWGAVKDHDGLIDVSSQLGKGTTFTLTFPVVQQDVMTAPAAYSAEAIGGKGESILVVDDMADQRELACKMLEHLGYSVASVASGEEALAFLEKNKADLLVLDMIMNSGFDGLETYKKVLDRNPEQRTIFASGYAHPQHISEAMSMGAHGFIKKPYVLQTIGLAVRKALDRQAVAVTMPFGQSSDG